MTWNDVQKIYREGRGVTDQPKGGMTKGFVNSSLCDWEGCNDKAQQKKEAEGESILTSGCAFMIALRLER
jgi:hypothetical protein